MVVYKTTNITNGKIYVGKDVKNNPEYLGSGLILKNAITKHGKENFVKEVLETCFTHSELNEREKYWIKQLNSTDKNVGYNISPGGYGGNIYVNLPDEIKGKIKTAVANANKSRPKVYGENNKTYRKIDDSVRNLILKLSVDMGRGKIHKTLMDMGIRCISPRSITRRLHEWQLS